MLLKRIAFVFICFLAPQMSFGQNATSLTYGKIFKNQEILLPNLTPRDSNKVVILIFIKDSYKEENTWLRKIDQDHIIDTSHVVIYKINLPAMCDTTPAAERIVINNLNLYNFPNHHKQIKFEIILQANDFAKNWALSKLVSRRNLFNPLNNEIPDDVSNPKKLKPAKVYSIIDDTKIKDDFIFLVTKTPEYSYINEVQNEIKDSFELLKKQYLKIDSLYKLTQNQQLNFEYGILSNLFYPNEKSTMINYTVKHLSLNYCRSMKHQSPLYYTIGIGMDRIHFVSSFMPEKLTLGYFTDAQGDKYKSELLNFQGNENTIIKNFDIELGLKYYRKSPNLWSRKFNYYAGFQFGLNSKPVIETSELFAEENILETRQYEILNFDKLTIPADFNIEYPENLRNYYTSTITLGFILKLSNQFYAQTNLIQRTSTNLAINQIPAISRDSEKFIFSPIIFSQRHLNTNSIGLTISLIYDIH